MRVTQPLQRNLQQIPHDIATIDGERRRTWAEFVDRVARLAGGLRGLGVAPGDRVAVIGLNSDRHMEVFFAVPWAGAVIVPTNYRWSAPEIAFSLNDSGTRVLFIDHTFWPLVAELRALVDHPLTVICIDAALEGHDAVHDDLVAAHAPLEEHVNESTSLSGIFYTGGTTGRSKGVMLTHGNHVANTLQFAAMISFGADICYLHAAPMFHIADALYIYLVTHLGGRHVFIPRFEPAACAAAMQEHGVTDTILVPTMIQMLLEQKGFADFDLSRLERLYYGASPMPEAVAVDLIGKLPHVAAYQLYGQTESAPLLTALDSRFHVTEGPLAGRLRSAGRAVPAVEIRIVDENDVEVPRGQVGEIVVRGPNIMKGYWGRDDLTAEALRGGWLHTGDAAYMDEGGFIFISDRLKDMIISGGENVYSTEVENALYQHPDVAQVAVIGVPDEKWGERVHAVVVPREGANPDPKDLMAFCRSLIADYKCPRSVSFRDEPLPLSGAGKVLKTELRKPFWSGRDRQVN
ncbi:MAG: long-chain fatty acid--CoA ligase [Gammaproteobacteria bacterium]|nr:long-chain fatty acid--CoA ligase [Gammaproteobacteria bacterium]MCP5198788.1 long-chain fatty acid--CoA ligase [Gammaproteobacteria bacterium]